MEIPKTSSGVDPLSSYSRHALARCIRRLQRRIVNLECVLMEVELAADEAQLETRRLQSQHQFQLAKLKTQVLAAAPGDSNPGAVADLRTGAVAETTDGAHPGVLRVAG